MKRFALLFVILASLSMSSCLVIALHPFYYKSDKVFDERLIGDWIDSDSCFWKIEANKTSTGFMNPEVTDSAFMITYSSDEGKALLTGTLFRLDGESYMDFTPDPDEEHCMSEMTSFHHIPVHTLARMEIRNDSILLFWLGEEWLNELFDENRIKIPHETIDIGGDYSRHVLTAPTEELQKFIRKYVNSEEITKQIDAAFATGEESDYHATVFLKPMDD